MLIMFGLWRYTTREEAGRLERRVRIGAWLKGPSSNWIYDDEH